MKHTNTDINNEINRLGAKAALGMVMVLSSIATSLSGYALFKLDAQDGIVENQKSAKALLLREVKRIDIDNEKQDDRYDSLSKKVDYVILITGENTTNVANIRENMSEVKSILREIDRKVQ